MLSAVSTDAEWKKFLSREPHTEGPVKEKKGHSKTTMSARSMVLSDVAPADDQIMLQEFRDFVGLSVFKALKTVQENDDDDSRANNFRKGLAELGLDEANQEKFDMLAKVVKIFSIFDRDGSGSIDYDELRKALSAYRVPVTKDELSHIYRVIDPDQVQPQPNGQHHVDSSRHIRVSTDSWLTCTVRVFGPGGMDQLYDRNGVGANSAAERRTKKRVGTERGQGYGAAGFGQRGWRGRCARRDEQCPSFCATSSGHTDGDARCGARVDVYGAKHVEAARGESKG